MILRLYITGRTPSSQRALRNLEQLLAREFPETYQLEVIDVLEHPQLAEDEKILATPTLVKELPPPLRKMIGDLSDRERVLFGLNIIADEKKEADRNG